MIDQLQSILADYEARGREPQRVLELIACLSQETEEEPGSLCSLTQRVRQVIAGWEDGARSAPDTLDTIGALLRQQQWQA